MLFKFMMAAAAFTLIATAANAQTVRISPEEAARAFPAPPAYQPAPTAPVRYEQPAYAPTSYVPRVQPGWYVTVKGGGMQYIGLMPPPPASRGEPGSGWVCKMAPSGEIDEESCRYGLVQGVPNVARPKREQVCGSACYAGATFAAAVLGGDTRYGSYSGYGNDRIYRRQEDPNRVNGRPLASPCGGYYNQRTGNRCY